VRLVCQAVEDRADAKSRLHTRGILIDLPVRYGEKVLDRHATCVPDVVLS
jgi:hypothetical protein